MREATNTTKTANVYCERRERIKPNRCVGSVAKSLIPKSRLFLKAALLSLCRCILRFTQESYTLHFKVRLVFSQFPTHSFKCKRPLCWGKKMWTFDIFLCLLKCFPCYVLQPISVRRTVILVTSPSFHMWVTHRTASAVIWSPKAWSYQSSGNQCRGEWKPTELFSEQRGPEYRSVSSLTFFFLWVQCGNWTSLSFSDISIHLLLLWLTATSIFGRADLAGKGRARATI